MDMKKMITGLCIVAVILAVYIIGEIVREQGRYETVHYQIETAAFTADTPELKIVFLSDLHNREYGEKNAKLVEDIRRQHPDLILCTGDMLVGKVGTSFENAATFMKQLPEIAPVYYASGNHEQRMKEYPDKYGEAYREYKKELEDAGVHYLENEQAQIDWNGKKVVIHGLEIPVDCYGKLHRHILEKEEITERLGAPAQDAYHVLLAHNPEFTEVYKEWGADLILSGHLHGGIVRLPFVGGVVSPRFGLFPKYSGDCYKDEDATVVVSKGLGTHTVNIRLWNPAELIVLHVGGNRAGEPGGK